MILSSRTKFLFLIAAIVRVYGHGASRIAGEHVATRYAVLSRRSSDHPIAAGHRKFPIAAHRIQVLDSTMPAQYRRIYQAKAVPAAPRIYGYVYDLRARGHIGVRIHAG
jgi:hypothetical protein